jgi:hypothetical protein
MADLQSASFAAAFGTLKDTPNAATFLRRCPDPRSPPISPPPIALVFPKFKEDAPDIQALAEYLWLQAINYVIPLRKRRHAAKSASSSTTAGDLSLAQRLSREAKRAFIEFTNKNPSRASEVGELLAYILALEHLNATQVASKLALKTNSNMPVHGLDGIHASFESGIMTLYFLEAKLALSANSGVKEYVKSVAGFGTSRKQYLLEYEILSDLGNLDALPSAEKEKALEYLDIYGSKKGKRLERAVGVICHTEKKSYGSKLAKSSITTPDQHEAHFETEYSKLFEHHHHLVANRLAKAGVDPNDCLVFFLAFPDIADLRSKFYEVMSG